MLSFAHVRMCVCVCVCVCVCACVCVCVYVCGKLIEWTNRYTLFSFIVKTLRLAWPKENVYWATFVTAIILA